MGRPDLGARAERAVRPGGDFDGRVDNDIYEPFEGDVLDPGHDQFLTRLRDQLVERQQMFAVAQFEACQFLAEMKSARISASGDLDITLTVPMSEKYRAIPLTDAIGIEVVIQAHRKRRAPLADQEVEYEIAEIAE